MTRHRPHFLALVVVVAASLGLTACETTQELSAKREKALGNRQLDTSLVPIGNREKKLKVISKTLIRGKSSSAVAVEVRNTGSATLFEVPVAIRVKLRGKSIYTNRLNGLGEGQLRIPSIGAGKSMVWVNDQLPVTPKRAKLKVSIGSAKSRGRKQPAALAVGKLKQVKLADRDSVAGKVSAPKGSSVGRVAVFVAFKKAGRIVAAGSSEISSTNPGQKTDFTAFVTGKAAGATRLLYASPGPKLK